MCEKVSCSRYNGQDIDHWNKREVSQFHSLSAIVGEKVGDFYASHYRSMSTVEVEQL